VAAAAAAKPESAPFLPPSLPSAGGEKRSASARESWGGRGSGGGEGLAGLADGLGGLSGLAGFVSLFGSEAAAEQPVCECARAAAGSREREVLSGAVQAAGNVQEGNVQDTDAR